VDIEYFYGNDVLVDSFYIWAINRSLDELTGSNAIYVSFDEGATWHTRDTVDGSPVTIVSPRDTLYHDIGFLEDYVILGGQDILGQVISFEEWIWGTSPGYQIQDSLNPITSISGIGNSRLWK